jgi:Opacity protein and related surface antigens
MFRSLPILASVAVLAFPAHAQLYAGGAIGESKASFDSGNRSDQLLGLGFDDASTRADSRDTAYRAFLGYRFHRYFAAEVGYTDLGRYTLTSDVAPAGQFRSRTRVSGAEASLLGLLPLGERFTAFARVGVMDARVRTDFQGNGSVRLFDNVDTSTHKTAGVYGLGAWFDVAPRWSVRAEWTTYWKIRDEIAGNDLRPDAVMVGLTYRF